ncbi:molecular chaperone HscC [Pelosinus propionicus]|uniref:Chaperone protein DnaK n=1 Tax=Pelosinus propionicus DSM 13327 TaxID=1123291 RepID=A0A1I4NIK1_9FIRM|nr:molecular chaperone HscC [Pelosinus propionicus]SFM15301.1 molecular chaperone HscC [Pelosinus propionicus DSM 13327]
MPIIGIDLGTTNSLVSYWTEEGAVIIPNNLKNNLTPSVISVNDNGEILVGQIAKERLISHPQLTVAVFKRYMGTKKTFQLGKYKFLPEELSSFIIRSLKQDAEIYLGEPIQEAVISVPAYFNDAQRKATKRAGELAGLKVERLINEPTAAATAYGLHQQKSETKFLIFDLGGGTFDVSIVELFENVMEVQAIAGDNYLGGEDFTEVLASSFIQQQHINRDNLHQKEYASILKQAEQCKQSLSQNVKGIMRCTINEKSLEWSVDRLDFGEAAKVLVNRLRQPVEKALKDASMKSDEVDVVILVGGATRMPLVHTLVSKLFGRLPACILNPDEVVALGAGIQAAMKERNAMLKEVVLTDVCPYTLGIAVAIRTGSGKPESGHFAPIIERNTVIPVSRVERFSTVYDNQKTINIEIFQGESRLTKNNIKLGQLQIEVPLAPAGEQSIDVRYTYDINGILEVEVIVLETGIKKQVIIEESPGIMSKDEIEQRMAALKHIKIHPRDRQENQLLIARGERLYEELLGKERIDIANALQRFESVMNQQDLREINKAAAILRMKLNEAEKE